jgi:transposase
MTQQSSTSSSASSQDAAHLDPAHSPRKRAGAETNGTPNAIVPPDASTSRDAKGHLTQAFRAAAVRYALTCGKTPKQAAADMGISSKSISDWANDAQPSPNGEFDVQRFDELAQLRTRVREQDALLRRVTDERDFLKKVSAYFAAPSKPNGGSK